MLRVAQLQVGARILCNEGKALCDLVERTDGGSFYHQCGGAVIARTHVLHVDADLVVVYVPERVQPLLHTPVKKETNGELVCVARVCRGGAACNVPRQIFIEMGNEVFGGDGILTDVHRKCIHAAHCARGGFCVRCRHSGFRSAVAAVCVFFCHGVPSFVRF